MPWETEDRFGNRKDVVDAVYSTTTNEVYYIIDTEFSEKWGDYSPQYVVNLWPNRHVTVETVSILESFNELEQARSFVRDKTADDAL